MQPHDTTFLKSCPKCGQALPLTAFSRNRRNSDGLQSQCKACNRAYHQANRDRILERKRARYIETAEQDNARSRAYRAANLERLREYDRIRTLARRQWKAEYDRKYSEANRERIAEHSRTYRQANREHLAERARVRYAANPIPVRERTQRWLEANHDYAREYYSTYYLENRERVIERVRTYRIGNPLHPDVRRAKGLRRRALARSAEGSHTARDIRAQYERQQGLCYWCGCAVGDVYHVDHVIPLNRGGTNWPENLVIACPPCNTSKGDKLPEDWLERRAGRHDASSPHPTR